MLAFFKNLNLLKFDFLIWTWLNYFFKKNWTFKKELNFFKI
jgi:hypothetical protein